jgi:hypothetical protein
MPDFTESLQGRDLGHLRIIAQQWGIELPDQDLHTAILHLRNSLLEAGIVREMLSTLEPDVKKALDDLCQHSGRLPWAQFSRIYGEVREIGPARRDRERLFEHPVSALEGLWYRGLVARAFFDTPAGPKEFAYIPEDLLALFLPESRTSSPVMGRPASAADYAQVFAANDRLLDHACTYLAAIRVGIDLPETFISLAGEELSPHFLRGLLIEAGLLDEGGTPRADVVRQFLEISRGAAFLKLFQGWKGSNSINELRLLPQLAMEGKWENDPLRTRKIVLEWLTHISPGTWWNMGSFLAAVKQHSPDYQRPAGDYDTWFIKDLASGMFLRGFSHWDEVDGRLIRFLINGPLHWLGVVDLASPDTSHELTAFRLSRWSQALFNDKPPSGMPVEKETLAVRSDARIGTRRLVPRSARYQLARFCDWEKEDPDGYMYRITPGSLGRAKQQGLKVGQLVTLLNRYARAVPPSLVKALERWEKLGTETRLEKMVVLRLSSEEILPALRKSRAGRFLGEPLGPTTIAIQPGAMDKVLAALAELGYLGEIRGDAD